MIARRVHRADAGDYGYEICDDAGRPVETGAIVLYGNGRCAAHPDLGDGTLGPPRPGSEHPSSPEVLVWLSQNGPAGGAR